MIAFRLSINRLLRLPNSQAGKWFQLHGVRPFRPC
jgi:hypothetical protein